jgi:peptide/nickel transport system substrate-binding protein
VGTGPFMVKEFTRDSRIVLDKNPKYWMPGLPKLDQVIMNVIPDRAVQVQGLVSGDIDAVEFVDPTDFPVLQASKDVVIDKSMSALIQVMAMNCTNPILSDVRVRQAVNYAIDKQKVLDVAYGGGKIIGTFMDVTNAYYKDFTSLYPYNPDKAKALLKEVNLPADASFTMVLPQNYDMHVNAGQLYQEMLSKVGLKVNIKLVDWSTWLSDVYSGGKYDFTVIGHTGKLDPDGTVGGYGKGKYVKWDSPATFDLISKAKLVAGFDARKKLYDQALETMAKEVPFVYLGTSFRYKAYRSNVVDYRMTPKLDTFDFRWTDLK